MLNGNKNLVTKQTIFMWALNTNIPKRKRPVQIAILSLWPGKQGIGIFVKAEILKILKNTHIIINAEIYQLNGSVFVERKGGKSARRYRCSFLMATQWYWLFKLNMILAFFFSSSFDCTSTLSSADDSTCTFDCAALTGIINDDPKTFTMLAESDKWNGSRTRDFFCWFFNMKCSRPWINKIGTEHKR